MSTSPQQKGKKHKGSRANRKRFFYLISALIPVLFFVILELLLRLVGFGHTSPVFIDNPVHQDYQLARPDLMKRYFPFSKNPPQVTMEADFFLKQKPDNGFRVFVQGGSTAAGFPYGLGASLAGTLEQRLRLSMPTKHVEVINTAMSAVNSHTLLDIADEIIEQQPDMVLIYAGHNEFLGIMGASSNFTTSNSYWLTRSMLILKDYRLIQLFQFLYAQFEAQPAQMLDTKSESNKRPDNARTMMAQVAENQSIEFDGKIYQAGLSQFASNMQKLVDKYREAGVSVYISTITSNVKDQPPFNSKAVEDELQSLVDKLSSPNISTNDIVNIANALETSESALLHFELGKLLYQRSQFLAAQKHFELALNHDLLKFRAPQAMNDIVETLATQDGVYLVDSAQYFKARSANGIVGNELMLEHLHPNLRGYFVISEAFYQAIAQNKPLTSWQNVSINQAWQERLVLPSEEYYGFATIKSLTSDYPFVETPIPLSLPVPVDKTQALGLAFFNKEKDWLSMMKENLQHYTDNNNRVMRKKTLMILADALPHDPLYNAQVADLLRRDGNTLLANYYTQRAKRAGAIL